jgi:hypothetical protein
MDVLKPLEGPCWQCPWSLDICKGPGTLRRSKIFMVTGLEHAISSVGAASTNRDPQVGKCIFGHAAR